jgi:hypothetical protein
MGGPLAAAAGVALKKGGQKALKKALQTPAGKKAQQKVVETGKRMYQKLKTGAQKSTDNSTVNDKLTQSMMQLKPSSEMSRGISIGAKFGRAQAAKEGVKAALVSGGAGYLLGKKNKK